MVYFKCEKYIFLPPIIPGRLDLTGQIFGAILRTASPQRPKVKHKTDRGKRKRRRKEYRYVKSQERTGTRR